MKVAARHVLLKCDGVARLNVNIVVDVGRCRGGYPGRTFISLPSGGVVPVAGLLAAVIGAGVSNLNLAGSPSTASS